jgi:hypothetical protein
MAETFFEMQAWLRQFCFELIVFAWFACALVVLRLRDFSAYTTRPIRRLANDDNDNFVVNAAGGGVPGNGSGGNSSGNGDRRRSNRSPHTARQQEYANNNNSNKFLFCFVCSMSKNSAPSQYCND